MSERQNRFSPRGPAPFEVRRASLLLLSLALWASGPRPALSQTAPPATAAARDAATGPTIRLDYGGDQSAGNPVASFMYFVPLISPEPVSSSTSAGSTQAARVLSARRKSTAHSFIVTCDFEFTGNGSQQSILDLGPTIRRHERELSAGGSIGRQLSSITVNGPGSGTVEVEGTVSNNVDTVREVRLRFNAHHKPSPVSIALCEIRYIEGEYRRLNEIVARVNTLTFRREPGQPKMEVTVASVKNKAAGDGLWQNFAASVKGLAVNLLIDPLTVEAIGHRAMLDFGRALSSGAATFTFPRAPNLKSSSSTSTNGVPLRLQAG
ncbi:MAG TPA: hypothetical protein VMU04_23330 [Candidatus Acidoferrum sp.]|nr:hypothetical protein [Candidatus Acidoferrum sp.]